MSKRRYMWYGHASSEGGPLSIADADAWASWGGALAAQGASTIAFPSGPVAIVWAPVAPGDVAESTDLRAALRAAADFHHRVACGAHEDEDWSCRWARFTRMD